MMLEREWWLDVAENQLGDADAWQRVSGRKGAPPAAFAPGFEGDRRCACKPCPR